MSAEAADRYQQAQNIHDEHACVLFGARAFCAACQQPWPCPAYRSVLPLILDRDGYLP